eukprot:CAMPEP_0202960364 /NCGR_PEP_ID=MMETSP1396-20130829/4509_1 /ASSEMBLY_ACC=CAM_ASM_000872 /TAXON_ID= /ORGANISM="Pseudokeronopsis sp., Strain Brazil" /LENGTH=110 /DNA_ID=CAMNT_0049679537 /DNA_START=188 /DNA_END=520 /DNA_ORIENTATION=+
MAETGKSYTIKKILHELEKELVQVEEENYSIIKEQAEQRMLKANPKLALQRQKQLEKEMRARSPDVRDQGSPGLRAPPSQDERLKFANSMKAGGQSPIPKKILKDSLDTK